MRSDSSSRGGLGDQAQSASLVMGCVLRSRRYWPRSIERGERACVMLTAIALQESDGRWRTQRPHGPARSWWQLEPIAVRDVLTRARHVVGFALVDHGLAAASADKVHASLAKPELDDLAATIARAFLWLDPEPLPDVADENATWECYIRAWRPGKPLRERWAPRLADARRAWSLLGTT